VGVEAVDAHRHGLAEPAPIDVLQGGDDVLAGLLLLRRGDRVLEVEEHVVGLAEGGLLDEFGVGARHGELAAVQTGPAQRVEGVAHRISS
jgi:hypothetical protein